MWGKKLGPGCHISKFYQEIKFKIKLKLFNKIKLNFIVLHQFNYFEMTIKIA